MNVSSLRLSWRFFSSPISQSHLRIIAVVPRDIHPQLLRHCEPLRTESGYRVFESQAKPSKWLRTEGSWEGGVKPIKLTSQPLFFPLWMEDEKEGGEAWVQRETSCKNHRQLHNVVVMALKYNGDNNTTYTQYVAPSYWGVFMLHLLKTIRTLCVWVCVCFYEEKEREGDGALYMNFVSRGIIVQLNRFWRKQN